MSSNYKYKYDNETCEKVLSIYKQGRKNFNQIAAEVNIPSGTVRRICRGLTETRNRKIIIGKSTPRRKMYPKKEVVAKEGIFEHDPYYYTGWNW